MGLPRLPLGSPRHVGDSAYRRGVGRRRTEDVEQIALYDGDARQRSASDAVEAKPTSGSLLVAPGENVPVPTRSRQGERIDTTWVCLTLGPVLVVDGERDAAEQVFRYPGSSHLFAEPTCDDFNPRECETLIQRAREFFLRVDAITASGVSVS
jgi:hypothetical protein